MKQKLMIMALLTAISVSLLAGSAQLAQGAELNGQLVRLHVIAASDSQEDQCVKLIVRDAILEAVDRYACSNMEEAIRTMRANVDSLAGIAQQTLLREGINQRVEVRLCTERYPQRCYGTFSLPAGEYVSLQVRIGAAEGQNWWCVVYPALCHACDEGMFREAAQAAGFSDGQIRLMSMEHSKVQFRFKIFEILQKLKNFF